MSLIDIEVALGTEQKQRAAAFLIVGAVYANVAPDDALMIATWIVTGVSPLDELTRAYDITTHDGRVIRRIVDTPLPDPIEHIEVNDG